MRNTLRCHQLVITIIALVMLSGCVWGAGIGENSFAHTASDSIGPFLAIGELTLLAGDSGKQEAVLGAKALAATTFTAQLLKVTVRERRPNSTSRSSFPSGHTASAFAMATVIADCKPQYKWPAYAAAATIGWSRVELGAHRWHDVIAGAALGYYTAKHFTNNHIAVSPDGISYNWKM